jgi:hypothetical protein
VERRPSHKSPQKHTGSECFLPEPFLSGQARRGDAAMWETIKEITLELIKSLHGLLLLLGFVVFVFSLIGGIHYAGIAPFDDQHYRTIGLVVGILIMALSVLIWFILPKHSTVTIPKASAHGIKITSHSDGDNVPESVTVRLEVQKPLPQGYDLYIFRVYPRSGHLYPASIARHTGPGKVWEASPCSLGGRQGEERIIAAFLVGPSGQALVQYFHDASDSHGRTLQELRKAMENAEAGEYLPNIRTKTQDMVECCQVKVRRS